MDPRHETKMMLSTQNRRFNILGWAEKSKFDITFNPFSYSIQLISRALNSHILSSSCAGLYSAGDGKDKTQFFYQRGHINPHSRPIGQLKINRILRYVYCQITTLLPSIHTSNLLTPSIFRALIIRLLAPALGCADRR